MKLRLTLAFLIVVIIWSTTPLALQISTADTPLTSALIRMILGVAFCFSLVLFSSQKLLINKKANIIYLTSGVSIFLTMSLLYYAANSIPSGWISILFGLSPLLTGIFSIFVEPNMKPLWQRLGGASFGLLGLYLVFRAGQNLDEVSISGIITILIGVVISSVSAVVIRQQSKGGGYTGVQITTGGLIVAIPLFALSALIFEPALDINFSNRQWLSIFYLGFVGTGIGFTLYYFLLQHVSADKVALITLVTPIFALLIGSVFNNEPVLSQIWLGAFSVIAGLIIYEYRPRLGLRKI